MLGQMTLTQDEATKVGARLDLLEAAVAFATRAVQRRFAHLGTDRSADLPVL